MNNFFSPLFTDLYQLTMAYGYWRAGIAEQETVFHLFFRKNPFEGHYAVACGLAGIIDFLTHLQFSADDLAYLRTLRDAQGQLLFNEDFLSYLKQLTFSCDVDASREGQVMLAKEPLLRVQGPLLQCQLVETALVNQINFASIVATKAARICQAAGNDSVIEFGMRRAQGWDGALTASRAAYIGGCEAVSNTLAGQRFGIPVRGTVAHSWIMAFKDEPTAFSEFARILPNNVTLLVDTYDTLEGVRHAITVGQQLRKQGQNLTAVRLDSGNFAYLSKKTRELLDQAGFADTAIMASGDLDENLISQLKQEGAPIDIWGVGTRLVTAYEQPSLDCAYKLSAIQNDHGEWQYKFKRSEQLEKTTLPGIPQVRRYYLQGAWVGDIIYDTLIGPPTAETATEIVSKNDAYEDLLHPIFQRGQLIYQSPSIQEIRHFCQQQITQLTTNPLIVDYQVMLEIRFESLKKRLAQELEEKLEDSRP